MLTSGLSAACLLITPCIGPLWIQNDGAVVAVMRTVATQVSCSGEAALVSDARSVRLGVSVSCARVRARVVRARVAHAGALTGAGCVHFSGSVGGQVCCRWSSWQDAAVQRSCGGGVHTRCGVLVVKCQILANCSHGVVQVRDTHRRFKLCARIAPSCAHRCASMRIEDTRLSIPAAGRMCSTFAELSITAASWLQGTCVTLRRCTSDGCADIPQMSVQMLQCDVRIARYT